MSFFRGLKILLFRKTTDACDRRWNWVKKIMMGSLVFVYKKLKMSQFSQKRIKKITNLMEKYLMPMLSLNKY